MICNNKKFKKIKNKFKDINQEVEKHFTIYSHGGSVERSFKQRVGKKVNKDWDRKTKTYNIADKVMKNIEDVVSGDTQ